MPRFEPYGETTPLPAEGEGYERAMLDLKRTIKNGFHLAKDVAAFANHLGGTLLVGAEEINGCVGRYHPLDDAKVSEAQKAASESVRDRCSPRPLVDFARIPRGSGVILAVNVWPYIGQVVGVAVKCSKANEGYGGNAFVFPMRTGVDSPYLLPEQLPMFMTPGVRRTVLLLQRIPAGEAVRVKQSTGVLLFRMGEVDEMGNAVRFLGDKIADWVVALDQVRTVVQEINGWLVVVDVY
jgi:schlafen family protein